MTKYIIIPLLLITSSIFADDLSSKATLLTQVLNSIGSKELAKGFVESTVIGKAFGMIKDEESNKKLESLVKKSVEGTAIQNYTEAELQVISEMINSSDVHKSLCIKMLVNGITTDPKTTMSFSKLMMEGSKRMMSELKEETKVIENE